MTYYAASASPDTQAPLGKLQEIGDLYSSAELYLAGISALLFVALIRALYPLTTVSSLRQIVKPSRLRSAFLPGLLRGIAVATAFMGALLVTGYYRMTGFFVQLDEPWVASLGLLSKAVCLFAMIYSEEFLIRRRFLDALQERFRKIPAALTCTLVYCGLKWMQFDLGWMQTLTLLIISLMLSIQAAYRRDFSFGAGLWSGTLFVFHILFGLSIFGINHTGLFLVRYTGPILDLTWADQMTRLLTGGVGGPLSSGALQVLLFTQILISLTHRIRRIRKFRLIEASKTLRSS